MHSGIQRTKRYRGTILSEVPCRRIQIEKYFIRRIGRNLPSSIFQVLYLNIVDIKQVVSIVKKIIFLSYFSESRKSLLITADLLLTYLGNQHDYMQKGEWYPDHILSWYQYKDQKNVKFVYYENLIKVS